ncbi:MAG: hypothetical protein HY360_07115 [Verrucomicrobia bacterium]|nr:hypothetical protein [Verrucomicrobiota bacterium]
MAPALAILGNHYDFGQPQANRHPTIENDPAVIEQLVRWKRRAGFDTEFLMVNHSYFEGQGGDDPKAYCFKNFYGYREDWLSRYLPVAHRHGMRVIIYFNCHWLKAAAFPPDCYVVDADGRPKVLYGDGGEICCRGPYRQWSEKMAEDLGRYPIAGVFLDGPVKDSCWCPHCRKVFQDRHGRPLPEKPADLPLSFQADYEAFLTEMPAGYVEAFARGLRKHNPHAVLCCNGGDSRQMKATLPWTQLLGEEGGFVGYAPACVCRGTPAVRARFNSPWPGRRRGLRCREMSRVLSSRESRNMKW